MRWLNPAVNTRHAEGLISAPDSGVRVYVWETNEELMVARGCMQCLSH